MKHIIRLQHDIPVLLKCGILITVSGIHIIDISLVISLHIHLVRKKRIQAKHPSGSVPYDLCIGISPY